MPASTAAVGEPSAVSGTIWEIGHTDRLVHIGSFQVATVLRTHQFNDRVDIAVMVFDCHRDQRRLGIPQAQIRNRPVGKHQGSAGSSDVGSFKRLVGGRISMNEVDVGIIDRR